MRPAKAALRDHAPSYATDRETLESTFKRYHEYPQNAVGDGILKTPYFLPEGRRA